MREGRLQRLEQRRGEQDVTMTAKFDYQYAPHTCQIRVITVWNRVELLSELRNALKRAARLS